MTEHPYYVGVPLSDLWNLRHDIPEQQWIVEGLLPVGFSILAAREKVGKSLLTLGSLAIPIALGSDALGDLQTKEGNVLMFALEESLATIRDRLERFFTRSTDTWYPPANLRLYLSDAINSWTDGAIDQLEAYICELTDVRCVVIDTLRLLAPLRKQGNLSDGYDYEYSIGSRLQQLALKHNVAILAVHHVVKSSYADIFDSIGGTAWTKSAETLLVLERDGKDLKLHARGRSVPTSCWRLKQDPDTLLWTRTDSDDHTTARTRRRSQLDDLQIADIFESDLKLRHSDIKRRITVRGFGESSVDRWLERRVQEGAVFKLSNGNGYCLHATDESDDEPQLPMPLEPVNATAPPPSSDCVEDSDGGGSQSLAVTAVDTNVSDTRARPPILVPAPSPSDSQGGVSEIDDPIPEIMTTTKDPPIKGVTKTMIRKVYKSAYHLKYKELVKRLTAAGYSTEQTGLWITRALEMGLLRLELGKYYSRTRTS